MSHNVRWGANMKVPRDHSAHGQNNDINAYACGCDALLAYPGGAHGCTLSSQFITYTSCKIACMYAFNAPLIPLGQTFAAAWPPQEDFSSKLSAYEEGLGALLAENQTLRKENVTLQQMY